MDRLTAAPLLGAVLLVALAGCDAALSDPDVARIGSVSIAAAPAGADGAPVFVRLMTPFDTTETGAGAGPYPLALATASEIGVATTDGPFAGDALVVEVVRCDAGCAAPAVIGRATVGPDAWRGAERTVEAAGVAVRIPFRKTTS